MYAIRHLVNSGLGLFKCRGICWPISIGQIILDTHFKILLATMASANHVFPNTLEGFGYAFNKDGQLRKIDPNTGQPGSETFDFKVSDDPDFCQKHYESLGEVITDHIYELLENDLKLHRLTVPQNGNDPSTMIFVTNDVLKNPDKLLILIHGSGVVRAGQWARSLIINDCLKSGTQLPYIEKARKLGYAVMVLNSNDNYRIIDGKKVYIKGSQDPLQHVDYVWKNYVRDAKAQHIAIVAHSYGGVCTVDLAMKQFSSFRDRVFAVALTDSVHSLHAQRTPSKVIQFLQKISCNWVSEAEPLDCPIFTPENEIRRVSAGHIKHEMTSWSSIESVFKFLQARYDAVTGRRDL